MISSSGRNGDLSSGFIASFRLRTASWRMLMRNVNAVALSRGRGMVLPSRRTHAGHNVITQPLRSIRGWRVGFHGVSISRQKARTVHQYRFKSRPTGPSGTSAIAVCHRRSIRRSEHARGEGALLRRKVPFIFRRHLRPSGASLGYWFDLSKSFNHPLELDLLASSRTLRCP